METLIEKRCFKCGLTKEADAFYCPLSRRNWRTQCKECARQWANNYRRKNQGKNTAYARKKKLGVSPEQVTLLLQEQENKCAICKQLMTKPHLDHNHVTNQVRGLLCSNCNLAIGLLKENQETLKNAIQYLEKHNAI